VGKGKNKVRERVGANKYSGIEKELITGGRSKIVEKKNPAEEVRIPHCQGGTSAGRLGYRCNQKKNLTTEGGDREKG